ncbi:MAG TPA: tautomerase family protein [Casimicrobiaceae bacterium]|jgi:phenylpyruvate tautomerase PptA (4-oxalocrotonate tautomerase family)|nr:tautomerase family protein [Casimicrobiaceae bacterium]
MPLVTVTLQKDRSPEFTSALLGAVHRSLVASGVPEADRFQRVLTLDEASFRYDARYPDVASARTGDFVLIEIVWSVGRSVKVKRKVAADIVAALARDAGLDPEQVMIVFIETAWENWAFAGGRLLHAT